MIKSLRRVILQRGISMNRTLSLVLAGVLVLGIFAGGCAPVGPTPSTEKVLARIDGVSIFADNCSPPQYFAKVLDLEGGCNQFDSYNVTRAENTTIVVTVFNLKTVGVICPDWQADIEHTIPLGTDFTPGVNYTVEANNVTATFVA
jgi:hypothetical protein